MPKNLCKYFFTDPRPKPIFHEEIKFINWKEKLPFFISSKKAKNNGDNNTFYFGANIGKVNIIAICKNCISDIFRI